MHIAKHAKTNSCSLPTGLASRERRGLGCKALRMCAGPACSGCTKCLLWYLIVPSVSIDQFSTDLANCIATSTNDCNCVSLLRLSCAKLVQPPTSHCRVLNCQGCCIGTAGHPVSPINVNQPELVAKHLLLEQILKGLRWAEPGRHMKNVATQRE